ncbi:hypothetical protein JCM9279_002704 [Rhodotorula babjevae]
MPGTAQPAVQLPRIQCPYTASSCPLFNPTFSASDVLGTSAGVRERAKPPPSSSAPFDPTSRDYLAQHGLPAALPSPSLGFADSMRAAQALSPVHHRSSGDSAASASSAAGPHAPAYSDYPIAPSPELSGATTGGRGRTVSGGSASPPTPGPTYRAFGTAAYGGEPVSPKTLPLVLSPALAGLPFAGRLPSIDLLDGASSSMRRPPAPPSPLVAHPSSLAAATATSTSTSTAAPTFSPPQRYAYDRALVPSGSGGSPTSDAYLAQVTPAAAATSPGLGLLCAASAVAYDYGGAPGMSMDLSGAQQQMQQQPGPGFAPPPSLVMPSEWRPAPQRRVRDAAGEAQWESRIEEIEDDADAEEEGEGGRAAGRGAGRSGSGSGSSAGAGAGPSASAQGFAPPPAPKMSSARASEPGAAADEGRPPAQTQEGHATATPFITKLQHVLANPAHHDVIRWNTDGSCVVYQHSSSRLLEILGKYFRHTSVMSLARQLNIYGFRRLSVGEMLRELEHLPPPPPSPSSSSTSSAAAAAAPPPPPPPIMSASEWSGFTHPSFWRDEPGRAVCDLSVLKPQGPKTEKGRANLAKKMAAGEGSKKRKKAGVGKVGAVRKGGLDLE